MLLSSENKEKVTHIWYLMAVERNWLKAFADQEGSLLAELARKRFFSYIGSVLAVLDKIEAFLSFELHLLAGQNDRLLCLAWRVVIYSLSRLQALVALQVR